MRKDVIMTTEDTVLTEIARIMLTHKIRRIPVVEVGNFLIGIVCRQDILKALIEKAKAR